MILTSLTFFFVLALVAYRLLWAAPSLAKLGILPKSWQRWIFDKSNPKKPN
jgi:hypothetical protein